MVWTDNCINTTAKTLDVMDLGQAYLEELAAAIGGEVVTRAGGTYQIVKNGTVPRITDLLEVSDAWREAIARFTTHVRDALNHA